MCCGIPFIGRQSSNAPRKVGVCDVCKLTDNVNNVKDVELCSVCNAWICDECRPKLHKRGYAALVKFLST